MALRFNNLFFTVPVAFEQASIRSGHKYARGRDQSNVIVSTCSAAGTTRAAYRSIAATGYTAHEASCVRGRRKRSVVAD